MDLERVLCAALVICAAALPLVASSPVIKDRRVIVESNLTCSGSLNKCSCSITSKEDDARLRVTVALPPKKIEPPYPLLCFFHGFGGRLILNSEDYAIYQQEATEAGYAVLQYDVISAGSGLIDKFLSLIGTIGVTDSVEIGWLPQLIEWAKGEDKLDGKIDYSRVAVAGHSRGGKIAGLHYTLETIPNIYTAFLIDPVDCSNFAPCSTAATTCYPPVYEQPSLKTKTLAIVGATVVGACNPNSTYPGQNGLLGLCHFIPGGSCIGSTYAPIYENAAKGSQLTLTDAGHLQFADMGIVQPLGNVACGFNWKVRAEAVCRATATSMVAWLDKQKPQPEDLSTCADGEPAEEA